MNTLMKYIILQQLEAIQSYKLLLELTKRLCRIFCMMGNIILSFLFIVYPVG